MSRSVSESSYGMTVSYGVLASGRASTRPARLFQTAFCLSAGLRPYSVSAVLSWYSASAAVSGAIGLAVELAGAAGTPADVSTGVQSAGALEGGEAGLGRLVVFRMGRLRKRPRLEIPPWVGRSRLGSYCGGCGHRALRGNTARRSAWSRASGVHGNRANSL